MDRRQAEQRHVNRVVLLPFSCDKPNLRILCQRFDGLLQHVTNLPMMFFMGRGPLCLVRMGKRFRKEKNEEKIISVEKNQRVLGFQQCPKKGN